MHSLQNGSTNTEEGIKMHCSYTRWYCKPGTTFRNIVANVTMDKSESTTRTLLQPQDQIVCQTAGQRFTLHHFRSVKGSRISTHAIHILKGTLKSQDSVT